MADFNIQMQFVVDMSALLLEHPDVRVGVIDYHSFASPISTLETSEQDKDTFFEELYDADYWGGAPTNTHKGIQAATQMFADQYVPHHCDRPLSRISGTYALLNILNPVYYLLY